MTVVRSIIFSEEKLWTKAVLFVGLVVLLEYGNLPSFLDGEISVIHKLYQQGLWRRGARVREWRCEDNENSGKKSCSHLARSTLPGGRGSLLHKVLHGEVSALGPTPACVAIVSCGLASKERGTRVEDRAKNGSRFISRAAKTENPVPRSSILEPFFARSLTFVPRSLLLNRTETLATQARRISKLENQFLCARKPTFFSQYKTFLVKMNFLPSL